MKTLQDIKDEVALEYTSGKHTWDDGYLNKSIKCILWNTVCKIAQREACKASLEKAAENVKMDKELENLVDENLSHWIALESITNEENIVVL